MAVYQHPLRRYMKGVEINLCKIVATGYNRYDQLKG